MTFAPAQPVPLSAGTTYWIVAAPNGDTRIGWYTNRTGQIGAYLRADGSWGGPIPIQTPALRVNGIAAPAAAPEPGTFALVTAAGVAAVAVRRPRRLERACR